MSLSPAIIDAMIASGCTAEQLAAVVKASLAEQEARAIDKRAKDAERQRRHRASRDVTQCHSDNADSVTAPPLSPPNDIYSNPPLNPPTKSKTARGMRLPDDWQPKPLPADLAAAVAAWPAGKLERELARFRDWAASATGPNAVKKDWDAAWRNWLRKADDETPRQGNGNSRPERSTTRQTGERVAARFAAGGGSAVDLVPRLSAPGWHD